MLRIAPGLARKSFVKYVEAPRKLRPPDPPSYENWIFIRKRLADKFGLLDSICLDDVIEKLFQFGNFLNRSKDVMVYGPLEEYFSKGWIDFEGLRIIFTSHVDPFVLESDVRKMFEDTDLDRDGKITFEEFRNSLVFNVREARNIDSKGVEMHQKCNNFQPVAGSDSSPNIHEGAKGDQGV
jgi:hypothetical protein